MWPVRIDAAARVAELVLRGAAFGEEPHQALRHLQRDAPTNHSAPAPAAPIEDRHGLEVAQHLAFIAWSG